MGQTDSLQSNTQQSHTQQQQPTKNSTSKPKSKPSPSTSPMVSKNRTDANRQQPTAKTKQPTTTASVAVTNGKGHNQKHTKGGKKKLFKSNVNGTSGTSSAASGSASNKLMGNNNDVELIVRKKLITTTTTTTMTPIDLMNAAASSSGKEAADGSPDEGESSSAMVTVQQANPSTTADAVASLTNDSNISEKSLIQQGCSNSNNESTANFGGNRLTSTVKKEQLEYEFRLRPKIYRNQYQPNNSNKKARSNKSKKQLTPSNPVDGEAGDELDDDYLDDYNYYYDSPNGDENRPKLVRAQSGSDDQSDRGRNGRECLLDYCCCCCQPADQAKRLYKYTCFGVGCCPVNRAKRRPRAKSNNWRCCRSRDNRNRRRGHRSVADDTDESSIVDQEEMTANLRNNSNNLIRNLFQLICCCMCVRTSNRSGRCCGNRRRNDSASASSGDNFDEQADTTENKKHLTNNNNNNNGSAKPSSSAPMPSSLINFNNYKICKFNKKNVSKGVETSGGSAAADDNRDSLDRPPPVTCIRVLRPSNDLTPVRFDSHYNIIQAIQAGSLSGPSGNELTDVPTSTSNGQHTSTSSSSEIISSVIENTIRQYTTTTTIDENEDTFNEESPSPLNQYPIRYSKNITKV